MVHAGARDAVVPLSNIRLRTGEHMVMSKSVAPHTLTAIEVDYENVEQVRKAHGAAFKEQEGFSLTYLPFISRATIDALREYPHLNASVGDRELVRPQLRGPGGGRRPRLPGSAGPSCPRCRRQADAGHRP